MMGLSVWGEQVAVEDHREIQLRNLLIEGTNDQ
jgi:hypothetical protein